MELRGYGAADTKLQISIKGGVQIDANAYGSL